MKALEFPDTAGTRLVAKQIYRLQSAIAESKVRVDDARARLATEQATLRERETEREELVEELLVLAKYHEMKGDVETAGITKVLGLPEPSGPEVPF